MATQTEPKQDSKQVIVEIEMPLTEARKVIWRGRGTREPMGKLWDSELIDFRDLTWAIDVLDQYPEVQKASRTMLAYWLGQPFIPRSGPEIIEGSRYLEENERDAFMEFNMYIGMGVGGGIVMAVWLVVLVIPYIFLQFFAGNWILATGIIMVALASIGWVSRDLYHNIKDRLNSYKTFRSGREGENKVVGQISRALDNRWTIYRNLHLPGHDDDIDIVLVGLGGVRVVEVKSTKYDLRVQGKRWEVKTPKGWQKIQKNPANQVTSDAVQLNGFLKRHDVERYVDRTIALSDVMAFDISESEIPVLLLPEIEEKIRTLTTTKQIREEEIAKINALFKDLATKQLAKEETSK